MQEPKLPHRIERTRNRCSRAIWTDEQVVIRLARGLSEAEEQRHVEQLLRRMRKAYVRMQQRTLIDPFRPLLQRDAAEIELEVSSGKRYCFRVQQGRSLRASRERDVWTITAPFDTEPSRLHRVLWHCLSDAEYLDIVALIDALNNDTLRAPVRDVKLRFATSKWGSCSGRNTVMLNTALLFVPRQVLHYVIVHELTHIEHPNHSTRFWATVGTMLPGFEVARDELKGFRLPVL